MKICSLTMSPRFETVTISLLVEVVMDLPQVIFWKRLCNSFDWWSKSYQNLVWFSSFRISSISLYASACLAMCRLSIYFSSHEYKFFCYWYFRNNIIFCQKPVQVLGFMILLFCFWLVVIIKIRNNTMLVVYRSL